MFQDFLQFSFSGLTSGAIYALIALGFCVVNNTMGIVNFVQVDFVSLGGMLMFSALFAAGLPMVPGLLLAVAGVALAAMLVERFGLRPARSDNHLVLIFLTVGLSIILRGIIKLVWGTNRMALPPLTPDNPVNIFGATVLPQALWILLLTVIAIGLLMWFFYRTPLGLSMRAVASNPTAATPTSAALPPKLLRPSATPQSTLYNRWRNRGMKSSELSGHGISDSSSRPRRITRS